LIYFLGATRTDRFDHVSERATSVSSPVSIQTQSLALLALRALRLDGNRAKRKRLRWQAANHGYHCFDRASYWLLHAANTMLGRSSAATMIGCLPTQAIAFGWKPGFTLCGL